MTRAKKHGGARKGAGRKPATPGGSVTVAVSMPRQMHERLLRAVMERRVSASEIVRAALEREL